MFTGTAPEARDWRVPALVALLVAVPVLVLLQIDRDRTPLAEVALQTGLIAYLVLFAGAVLLCFSWRLTRADQVGWIAAGMGIAAVQGIALHARTLAEPSNLADHEEWLLVVHLLLVITLVILALAARLRPLTLDPVAIGVMGGAVFALLRWWLVESSLTLSLPQVVIVVLIAHLCAGLAALVLAVLELSTVPLWVRVRIGGVVVLLSIAYLVSFPVPEGTVRGGISVAAHLAASVLVGATAFAMLRVAVQEDRQALEILRNELVRLDSLARIDRARLHQINATIAGIHSASHVLGMEQPIQATKRSDLAVMMRAEIARLERLVAGRAQPELSEVDVDAAIEPVVVRQRLQGQRIEWEPSGFQVWARSDELAEAVSTLLENADRHAPGAEVAIEVRRAGDFVEVVVCDSGPGVPPELGERIFDWGYASPASRGQGIGLAVARQLLEDVDGYLRYEASGPGARFVLGLRPFEGRAAQAL